MLHRWSQFGRLLWLHGSSAPKLFIAHESEAPTEQVHILRLLCLWSLATSVIHNPGILPSTAMDQSVTRNIEDHCEEVWFEEVSVENDPSDTNWNSLVALVSGINNQMTVLDTELSEINNRLKQFEEQQTISVSTIRRKMEGLKSQIPSLKSVLKTVDIDPVAPLLTSLLKPIQSKEELDELERKAKDQEYRNSVIQAAGRISGYDRKGEGESICFQMIDYFFDRKFLMECSWLGRRQRRVNGEVNKKIALIEYGNTMKLFHECISISDETFTQFHCYNFVRVKILRRSFRRVFAKKTKIPVKAPKPRSKKTDPASDLAVQAVVENQLRHLQNTAEESDESTLFV
ncbi:uncharacterized protein LOC126572050 [Anopheles aquasalis]|uniref:uncharacterized protein LOC126572050 n=1 Tax=Anopheles aquasalis TaxID=42839 RepID=UPI00215AA05E|nr:uncharacterized protein LOC126572050 [Anopheles aquasalis]